MKVVLIQTHFEQSPPTFINRFTSILTKFTFPIVLILQLPNTDLSEE